MAYLFYYIYYVKLGAQMQNVYGIDHRELKLDGAIGHFAESL